MPGKGGHIGLMSSKLFPTLERLVRSLTVFKEQSTVSSLTFFSLVDCEVSERQHHQPSGSYWSGVYMLVGSTQLNSSTRWGFSICKISSKDVAQAIVYSPWERTKGLWLCLMAKVLLFCLVWLFPFFPCCLFFN